MTAPDINKPDLDKTIEELCCGLKPCKRMGNPLWRSLLWMLIAILYVGVVALLIGMQPNTMERLSHHHYLFEMALAFATGVTASLVTFVLTVPDCRGKEWMLSIPATLFTVHFSWMLIRLGMEGSGNFPQGCFSHCWMDSALMAGVPAALVILLIRKGATVRPLFLAFNAVLAVASFGWIGIRLVCPIDTVGKAYFVNFLPFVAMGLVASLLARKLFRW